MQTLPVFTPKQLTALSPSQFSKFRNCPYSQILKKGLSKETFVQNMNAKLGSLWHLLVEEINDGRLTDRDKLRERWDDGLSEINNSREENQAPVNWEVKNYALFYLALLKKIDGAVPKDVAEVATLQSKHEKQFGSEIPLKIPPFSGKIDFLHCNEDGVHIIDYKTGSVFEKGEGDITVIKEILRDQMNLYAAMLLKSEFYSHYKIASLSLQTLDGAFHRVEFDLQGCINLFEEGKTLFEKVNEVISNKPQDLAQFAIVSQENCRYCDVKMVCSKYNEKRDTLYENPADLFGSILKVYSSNRIKRHNIVIQCNGQKVFIRDIPWGILPEESNELTGVSLFITNVSYENDQTFKYIKRTRIFITYSD